jgi:hypothetical protein
MTVDVFDSHRDEAGEIRVRFGEGLSQTMPLDWAEHMLSAWKEKQPKQWGQFLTEAAMAAK